MIEKSNENREEVLQRQYLEIAQLAGTLAHEIRNPLSTICLNLGILKEDINQVQSPIKKRMENRIEVISQECEQLERILGDFLLFTRGMELETVETDLAQEVTRFIKTQTAEASARGIELSSHFLADLPPIKLDQHQFHIVLLNLTLNAYQAMPEGGRIDFQGFRDQDHVVLEIIDTGTGMLERAKEKIFSLFYSTKPKGSGLGLPTVHKIIEAHGGRIDFESEHTKGTKFRISLPTLSSSPA